MFENYTLTRLRKFTRAARNAWKQAEAEQIWDETFWKLNLNLTELAALQDAWFLFVAEGDRGPLDLLEKQINTRLTEL